LFRADVRASSFGYFILLLQTILFFLMSVRSLQNKKVSNKAGKATVKTTNLSGLRL